MSWQGGGTAVQLGLGAGCAGGLRENPVPGVGVEQARRWAEAAQGSCSAGANLPVCPPPLAPAGPAAGICGAGGPLLCGGRHAHPHNEAAQGGEWQERASMAAPVPHMAGAAAQPRLPCHCCAAPLQPRAPPCIPPQCRLCLPSTRTLWQRWTASCAEAAALHAAVHVPRWSNERLSCARCYGCAALAAAHAPAPMGQPQ